MHADPIAPKKIAVLLEIETGNHTPERCFRGLESQYTLSVVADDVRDTSNPEVTAARIFEQVRSHTRRIAEQGFEAAAVATHAWQTFRDTMGPEVQEPFSRLLAREGFRYVELGTERCNESFREIMDAPMKNVASAL